MLRQFRLICLLLTLLVCAAAQAVTDPLGAYLWSIPSEQVPVPSGSVITEAVVILNNLSFSPSAQGKTLTLYLLRNGPAECLQIPLENNENPFEKSGIKFAVVQAQYIPNPCPELKIRFSRSNDPASPFWKIFQYPLVISMPDSSKAALSSLLLEINDALGSARSLSFGMLANGVCLESAALELTVRSYAYPTAPQLFRYTWQSNRPPMLNKIENQSATANQLFSLALSAADPDGDIISFSATPLPQGASLDGPLFSWKPDITCLGEHNITFTASDGRLSCSQTVSVTVLTPPNQPPVFTPVAGKTITEQDKLLFLVQANDPDGDPVSITATNLPYGAQFTDGQFYWQPALGSAGTYTVRFAASDSKAATFMDVIIVVQRLKFVIY